MNGLPQLLESLANHLSSLLDIINAEHQALEQGNPEALPELTRRKEGLARDLAGTWESLTGQLGLVAPVSRAAIEQALGTRRESGVTHAWARIQSLLEETDRLNRLNGKMIDEQLRRTRNAIDILQSAAHQRSLYGADGQSVDLFSPGRSIDEA